jgi:hypothetical protein
VKFSYRAGVDAVDLLPYYRVQQAAVELGAQGAAVEADSLPHVADVEAEVEGIIRGLADAAAAGGHEDVADAAQGFYRLEPDQVAGLVPDVAAEGFFHHCQVA